VRTVVGGVLGRLDPVTRSWAVMAGGSVARLGLGFVASVLVARFLAPADYGAYVVLGTVAGLAGVLADPGLTQAVVKRIATAPDESRAAHLASSFVWLRAAAATVLVLVLAIGSRPLAGAMLGRPDLSGYLVLALLGVLATALSGAVSTLLQASRRFGRLSVVLLVNSGLTALLAAGLAVGGWLNLGTALVILGVGTSLVSAVLGWRFLPWLLRRPSNGGLPAEAAQLFRFGRWLWLGDLLALAATQLDVLLVGRWGSLVAAGSYGLALSLASKVDVINHSLYTVLLPSAAALDVRRDVRGYVRTSLRRSGLVAAALLVLVPLAGPMIQFFYGPAFQPAVALFYPLLAIVVFDLFTTPLTLLAFSYDRPQLLAGADALRLIVLVGVGAWLIPVSGPFGAVVARGVSRIVGALVVVVALWFGRPRR
jgi:O-antigen/teichoic acid export membrane protein